MTKISKPSHEHHIHFFVEEQWYKLILNDKLINKLDPVKCLDSIQEVPGNLVNRITVRAAPARKPVFEGGKEEVFWASSDFI